MRKVGLLGGMSWESSALCDELINEGVRERLGGLTVAASGAEALVAPADGTFDAVVPDVQMPALDGPATLTALPDRGAAGDPPVVFVTGRSREEELAALRDMDVAGVLTKPFDPLTLAERVGELLGWST